MTSFQLSAVVFTLTAALAYINTRLLKLPSSVGMWLDAGPPGAGSPGR